MKTLVPSAPKELPRFRSGVKTPGRVRSRVDMFQTKKRVLPRTYSQRKTMLPRSDLRLKSGLNGMVASRSRTSGDARDAGSGCNGRGLKRKLGPEV